MAERARASRLGAALGCVALLALAACAGGGKGKDRPRLTDSDLLLMLTILPARYDNSAQAELDVRNNVHPAHEAVVLVITHVFTPRLGKYVYYVQESAADNPNRVLAEKMWSFELTDKHVISQTLYQFNEPARWRDGYLNKDLFTGVQLEDVQLEPCKLTWEKKGEATFTAMHDPKLCPAAGGAAAVPEMQLSATALSVGDYNFVRKGR